MTRVEFIEAPVFTQLLAGYLDDHEFRELQLHLVRSPEAGDVIQGTGGSRKMRWADPKRRRGKRGGLRIIHDYFDGDQQIWFLTIYGKGEAADLTSQEKRVLKAAIDEERRQRARNRSPRRK